MKMQKVLKYAVVITNPYSLISTYLNKEDAIRGAKLFAGGATVVPFKGMNCDCLHDPFFHGKKSKKEMDKEELVLFTRELLPSALKHKS